MKRKATQIAVPIVGSAGLDVKSLSIEHARTMGDLNEKLENGWRIFSTHAINNNATTYMVYVLTRLEVEECKEELK